MGDRNAFIEKVQSAFLGFVVGDALGVPVEFSSREERAANPVCEMRSGGAHGQTVGTWSDDTSMTLCVMQSLIEKNIDYADQMARFADWLLNGKNTPHGKAFDVGGTTKTAIFRFVKGTPALKCGETGDYSCGNGSLMRILPIAAYIAGKYGKRKIDDSSAEIIHNSSLCTHAHKRCQMACGIYCNVVFQMLGGGCLTDLVKNAVADALAYYKNRRDFSDVCGDFQDLADIGEWQANKICGSGYVIHTLQASLWCLLTAKGYAECVLKAVNLGEDTDTTAAVAGSLAGLWYGQSAIPADWLAALVKKAELYNIGRAFANACLKD
jgi:ADP-ribosylglycohydrolase